MVVSRVSVTRHSSHFSHSGPTFERSSHQRTQWVPPLPSAPQAAVSLGDDVDEASRLNNLVNQTTSWQQQSNGGAPAGIGRGRGLRQPAFSYDNRNPPAGYICHRCGQGGHFINNCPTNGDPSYDFHRMKKPTGIPKSFLKTVSLGDPNASLMLPGGVLATMAPNEEAFEREIQAQREAAEAEDIIPEEYRCLICKKLLVDPQLVTCCGMSFCKLCILPDDGDATSCPSCKSVLKTSSIIPNHSLSTLIKKFAQDRNRVKADDSRTQTSGTDSSIPSPHPPSVNAPQAALEPNTEEKNALKVLALPTAILPQGHKETTFTVIQPASADSEAAAPAQHSSQSSDAVCFICQQQDHTSDACPRLPAGWDIATYTQWLQQYYSDPRLAAMYYGANRQRHSRSPRRRRSRSQTRSRSRSRSPSRPKSDRRRRSRSRSADRSRRDRRRSRSRSRSSDRQRYRERDRERGRTRDRDDRKDKYGGPASSLSLSTGPRHRSGDHSGAAAAPPSKRYKRN